MGRPIVGPTSVNRSRNVDLEAVDAEHMTLSADREASGAVSTSLAHTRPLSAHAFSSMDKIHVMRGCGMDHFCGVYFIVVNTVANSSSDVLETAGRSAPTLFCATSG